MLHVPGLLATNMQEKLDSMCPELQANTNVCSLRSVVGLPSAPRLTVCLESQCKLMSEHRLGVLTFVLC